MTLIFAFQQPFSLRPVYFIASGDFCHSTASVRLRDLETLFLLFLISVEP